MALQQAVHRPLRLTDHASALAPESQICGCPSLVPSQHGGHFTSYNLRPLGHCCVLTVTLFKQKRSLLELPLLLSLPPALDRVSAVTVRTPPSHTATDHLKLTSAVQDLD
jgi:hypothetical protein